MPETRRHRQTKKPFFKFAQVFFGSFPQGLSWQPAGAGDVGTSRALKAKSTLQTKKDSRALTFS
jgi:hypothetical protein